MLIQLSQQIESIGSIVLKVGLNKLIGSSEISGILDDAASILKQNVDWHKHTDIKNLQANQITVVKTLLIYLNTILENEPNLTHVKRLL